MSEPTLGKRPALLPALGLVLVVCSAAADVPEASAPAAELERWMAEAEASLGANEMQLAESRLRSALAEGWLLSGAIAAVEGRTDAARSAFEQASVSAAETRRASTALAYLELKAGDPSRAVSLLRRVASRDPTSGTVRRLLAQALVAAGLPDQAVQELEEVVAAVPGDLESTFALASGYLQLEKVGEADRLFELIARQRPIPQTRVLIGRTYRDARRFERARSALEAALRQDPAVQRASYYLGTVELLERGADGLDAAVGHFERERELYPRDPTTCLYYGMALAEQRRFEEALPVLEVAAAWPPTRLDALRYLGRSRLGLAQPEEAADLLRQALTLAREQGARPRQMAFILYQLGSASRSLEARDEAELYFAQAERISAELVAADRDRLAELLSDAEPDLGAVPWEAPPPTELQRVSRLDPAARAELRGAVEATLARATFDLGVLAARGERFHRAVEHFEATAAIAPAFPRLARSLGVASFRAERFDLAARWLAGALEEAPGDVELRRMLALAHLNLEAYDRAAELLQDDPLRDADPSLRYAYALSLVRSDRLKEAETVFAALMAEHRSWPPLYVLLGQAHARQGAFDRAIEALDHALSLDPGVPEAQLTRGNIFLKRGELAAAEEALRAELSLRPEAVAARYLLAVVLDLGQQPEQAVEELDRVLFERPDHADARYLLGKIRLAGGRAEDAALHLEAAAALAPGDANVRYQLALAYQRLGRTELAGREFESYRELKRERPEVPAP